MQSRSKVGRGRAAVSGALVAVTALGSVGAVTAAAAPMGHPGAAPTRHHKHARIDVSPRARHAFRSIDRAIAAAHAGDTVVVARGTYREDVKVDKDIHLVGEGHPVIDAKGRDNGILITGDRAAGATVRGFDVRHADFEGILADGVTRVRIERNRVTGNDRGGRAAMPTGECAGQGAVPGDCGEGLHLMGVTHSQVLDNTVEHNAGGILLTDENGPTAFNRIARNRVLDNVLDCGITIAGHSTKAVTLSTASGTPTVTGTAPKVAGIYRNLVTGNVANGNGVKGEGGGILLAAGAPGSAVYDNTVRANTAKGNGLAGVTLHSHSPGQDLDGNHIVNNVLSRNGLAGGVNATPGDSDAGITQTVDITVWSAVTPLKGTVVTGNRLSDAHFGVWTQNVPTIAPDANRAARSVAVPLFQK
jgi:nitrous oxidase accessory protein NosD